MLKTAKFEADIQLEKCESQIGGGSLPLERIPSVAVTIKPSRITTFRIRRKDASSSGSGDSENDE